MVFKIVGADENSDFPTRVETRLATKFTNESYVDTAASAARTGAVADAKTYTDSAIGDIEMPGGLIEDPEDPGFFI